MCMCHLLSAWDICEAKDIAIMSLVLFSAFVDNIFFLKFISKLIILMTQSVFFLSLHSAVDITGYINDVPFTIIVHLPCES